MPSCKAGDRNRRLYYLLGLKKFSPCHRIVARPDFVRPKIVVPDRARRMFQAQNLLKDERVMFTQITGTERRQQVAKGMVGSPLLCKTCLTHRPMGHVIETSRKGACARYCG